MSYKCSIATKASVYVPLSSNLNSAELQEDEDSDLEEPLAMSPPLYDTSEATEDPDEYLFLSLISLMVIKAI